MKGKAEYLVKYFSSMSDEFLCECVKELTGQKEGNKNLRSVAYQTDRFLYKDDDFNEVKTDIFEEAAKRYLKIKMLQS